MLGVFSHHLWKTVIITPQDTLQGLLDPIFVAATGSVVIFNIASGFPLVNMVHFGFPLLPAFTMLMEHLLFVNSLDYSNMFSNFSHFWYLGLLAQFYLLFPLILRFILWMRPARAALTIIAQCWGAWGIIGWFCPQSQQSTPNM
jgi:peptidoglycan/LPS O-acetylase OafA/YrhL